MLDKVISVMANMFKVIFTRTIFLYLLAIMLIVQCIDYKNVIYLGKLRTLNRLVPSFIYLVEFRNSDGQFDRDKLNEYLYYFSKVDEYVPYREDAKAMMGYCYYRLGEVDKAVEAFEESIELNNLFFWSYYNLAVIHFKNQNYEKVLELLDKAVHISPNVTIKGVYLFTLYQQIISGTQENLDEPIQKKLKMGYKDSYLLMTLSYYYLNDFAGMFETAIRAIRSDLDENGEFYYYAGIAAMRGGSDQKGIIYLKEGISKNPEFYEAHQLFALILKNLGQDEAALKMAYRSKVLEKNKKPTLKDPSEIDLRIF